jgi:hypothetical protein
MQQLQPLASNGDFVIRKTRLKLGERVFSAAAPLAWNRLPSVLKTTRSTTTFKRGLKTFFFAPRTTTNLLYCVFTRIFNF